MAWAELVPPGGSEGGSVPCQSPRSPLLGAACALGIPWLVPTSLQSMPPSSLCVSVSPLPSVSYKTLVMIFRVYLNNSTAFPGGSEVKASAHNAGDLG